MLAQVKIPVLLTYLKHGSSFKPSRSRKLSDQIRKTHLDSKLSRVLPDSHILHSWIPSLLSLSPLLHSVQFTHSPSTYSWQVCLHQTLWIERWMRASPRPREASGLPGKLQLCIGGFGVPWVMLTEALSVTGTPKTSLEEVRPKLSLQFLWEKSTFRAQAVGDRYLRWQNVNLGW